MKIGQYILSLDQGTTSSRAVLFDALGGIAGMGQREFTQIYPQPGYVEHDAVEILQTQLYAMRQAVHEAEITAEDIAAISITNQKPRDLRRTFTKRRDSSSTRIFPAPK